MPSNRTAVLSLGMNVCFLIYGIIHLIRNSSVDLHYNLDVCSMDMTQTTAYDFKQTFGEELFNDFSIIYFKMIERIYPMERKFLDDFLMELPADDESIIRLKVLLDIFDKLMSANSATAREQRLQVIQVTYAINARFAELGIHNLDQYPETTLAQIRMEQEKLQHQMEEQQQEEEEDPYIYNWKPLVKLTDIYLVRQRHNYNELRLTKKAAMLDTLKALQLKWKDMYNCVPAEYLKEYPEYAKINELFWKIQKSDGKNLTFVIIMLFERLDNFFEYKIKLSQY